MTYTECVTSKATDLLEKWLGYWRQCDEMPAKMPEALHVRTATYLIQEKLECGCVNCLRDVEILQGSPDLHGVVN